MKIMKKLDDSILFPCGRKMKNRFMLSPLTNTQSNEDGTLSSEEFDWLTMRAKGQFGLVMTCASHVQAIGKGFPGQLGIFNDTQLEGHTRLAKAIKSYGGLAVIQLHHAGMRSEPKLIEDAPVAPSSVERKGARALTLEEVKELRDDFVAAAVRARKSGYDGVEIHGAHGYIVAQFLSKSINQREDEYGGNLENRARLLFEIVEGIRAACGADFLLGVRLSPERFGMELSEIKSICQQLIDGANIDFLDLSLWDSFKYPEEKEHIGKTLLQHFTELDFKKVKLTVAGKIHTGEDVANILNSKVDFVTVGRSGILHHDFPMKVMSNDNFETISLPVTREYLKREGLSDKFIEYMNNWRGFVASDI
jgi:2,4-dienoyl-CoA reductase-like NADH-dependent reductase (Old Yellow Enzyme family)